MKTPVTDYDIQSVIGYLLRHQAGDVLHPTVKAECDRVIRDASRAQLDAISRNVAGFAQPVQCDLFTAADITGQAEIATQ